MPSDVTDFKIYFILTVLFSMFDSVILGVLVFDDDVYQARLCCIPD